MFLASTTGGSLNGGTLEEAAGGVVAAAVNERKGTDHGDGIDGKVVPENNDDDDEADNDDPVVDDDADEDEDEDEDVNGDFNDTYHCRKHVDDMNDINAKEDGGPRGLREGLWNGTNTDGAREDDSGNKVGAGMRILSEA